MARDEKLMIRLDEKMKFEFQRYADRMGVTMSSLGSVIIGQWVDAQRTKERVEEQVLANMIDSIRHKVDEPMSDDQFEMFQRVAPAFVEAMKELAKREDSTKA